MHLTRYGDFEGVMTQVAAEEGWTFCDGEEPVAAETVFNEETFGPAILKLAVDELAARGIPVELGVRFEPSPDSLLGMRADFDDARNSLLATSWRITLSSYVVEQLPRLGADFDLSLLRSTFVSTPSPGTPAVAGDSRTVP